MFQSRNGQELECDGSLPRDGPMWVIVSFVSILMKPLFCTSYKFVIRDSDESQYAAAVKNARVGRGKIYIQALT